MSDTVLESQQQRQDAENKLATVEAEYRLKALESVAQPVAEQWVPIPIPLTMYPAFDEPGQTPSSLGRFLPYSNPDDRSESRYRPYYENETDLRRQRAEARIHFAYDPIALGAVETLSDYEIGEGFEFTAQAEIDGVDQLVADVQCGIDRFLEFNSFTGQLDREIHQSTIVDGESLPVCFRMMTACASSC